MTDYVSHLRFIHNTLTILSLTIMYLVWSSWTSGPELRSDLDGFLRTAEAARTVVEMPERLVGLVPEMPNPHLLLSSEITSTIGYPVLAVNSLRMRSATSLPSDTSPVGVQWRALQAQEWILQTLGSPEDDLAEVGAWIAMRRPGPLDLNRELRRRVRRQRPRSRLSTQDIRMLTTPILLPIAIDWPAEGSSGFAIVELEAYVPMLRSRFPASRQCEDLTGVATYRNLQQARELGIIFDCMTSGPYRFVAKTDTIRLPPSEFDKYSYLQREFDAISDLTPADALAWSVGQQTAGIRGRDPRFFGAAIRGEHLGLVGPIAMLFLDLYLLIMLRTLLVSVRKGSFDPTLLPWVATMRSVPAIVFSGTTLALLPAVATGFALWRLTTANPFVILVGALVLAGLGVWITVWGLEVDGPPCAVRS